MIAGNLQREWFKQIRSCNCEITQEQIHEAEHPSKKLY